MITKSMAEYATDFFERYYTEKIWELIPAIYRHEDGKDENENKGVLRSLVEIIARQAATIRRSQDRLWEDLYIDTCDDWAVPYIADLLGTRLVSAMNKRSRRVDVAKTVYYRRRNGTIRIQEELVSDVAEWESKVVEQFRRLARTRHGLDQQPTELLSKNTRSMPGGWANIRSARSGELVGGPFDEFAYTPDVRQLKDKIGKYNISKVAFHLFRLPSFCVKQSSPFAIEEGIRYTFDPLGSDVQMFTTRNRPDNWDGWKAPAEWQIPTHLKRNALNHFLQIDVNDDIVPNFLKIAKEIDGEWEDIDRTKIVAANLENWETSIPAEMVGVDPECGRIKFGSPIHYRFKVNYCYGSPAEVGAGSYARHHVDSIKPHINVPEDITLNDLSIKDEKCVVQIDDSATYDFGDDYEIIDKLRIQAANEERPFVRLTEDLRLTTRSINAELTFDGIWIGAEDAHGIILEGDYEKVSIWNCTIDPGGRRTIHEIPKDVNQIPVVIKGHVELLQVKCSIIGPIRIIDQGTLGKLTVEDSILQTGTYDLQDSVLDLNRVTLLGELNAHTLYASNSLFEGRVTVVHQQAGCFRFSAAPEESVLPKQYEPVKQDRLTQYIVSKWPGDPDYARLVDSAPSILLRGGENGAEIGAFNSSLNSIKLESLKTKVNEFLPFGLIPIFIYQT